MTLHDVHDSDNEDECEPCWDHTVEAYAQSQQMSNVSLAERTGLVNGVSNGGYVTYREFNRLEGTVNEISDDVKALLAVYNREEGANEERRQLLDATKDRGARRISWAAMGVGVLGSLWWAPHAVASLFH